MLDQDEGKRLYDVCLMENPDDTTVLHKVGKLCHYVSLSVFKSCPVHFIKIFFL